MKTKLWFFSRIVMGAIFFVFGLNGFFHFIPMQPEPEGAMAFLGGLMAAPYFFPMLKLTETVCGFFLLTGWFTPLALLILAPITLNIFMFHMFLAPQGLTLAFPLLCFHLICAWSYWPMYKGFFNKHCAYDCGHKAQGGTKTHGFKKSA